MSPAKAPAKSPAKAPAKSPAKATAAPHLTPAERAERGKAARREVPRESHADYESTSKRPDPIDIIGAQSAKRVQELIPIRYGRMSESPFRFYRGAAAIMASDLATTPQTGIRAQLCGDAHMLNFRLLASPERNLMFDINDFDETLPGPWEWDVKRLGASVAVAARGNGMNEAGCRAAVAGCARAYREAMRDFARQGNLEVWHARLDGSGIVAEWSERAGKDDVARIRRRTAKARGKDRLRAFSKLTTEVDGQRRIISDPPLIVPLAELAPARALKVADARVRKLIRAYAETLDGDTHALLEQYDYVDLARKVVGVGSVGTRTFIALLLGAAEGDPLFLQIKEAEASVLEPYAGRSRFRHHGRRVIEGQRLMQAASDIFLGWLSAEGIDGVRRTFYVRQLWDWKLSPRIEAMSPELLAAYAEMCAWTLARAHARSGDRGAIAAYLGKGDAFDRSLADFAEAYADQNERDHAALADAVKSGRVEARTGI
ncbi:MAG: DUF2252 domain-containing protein [Solirubrobacterales bacterium]